MFLNAQNVTFLQITCKSFILQLKVQLEQIETWVFCNFWDQNQLSTWYRSKVTSILWNLTLLRPLVGVRRQSFGSNQKKIIGVGFGCFGRFL